MLQYLVDDYLGGYDLPKIRTETDLYKLISENGVIKVEDPRGWLLSFLPRNIISIIVRVEGHRILYSDRTESTMIYPDRKSIISADRFNSYLM
jgi:hypothetical protein